VPGLYDRLKCTSPNKVTSILESAVKQYQNNFSEIRILNLGAGNGMMGDELKRHGVSRLIGVDIIPEAYDAVIIEQNLLERTFYS
jgi:predicted RNA methylase